MKKRYKKQKPALVWRIVGWTVIIAAFPLLLLAVLSTWAVGKKPTAIGVFRLGLQPIFALAAIVGAARDVWRKGKRE